MLQEGAFLFIGRRRPQKPRTGVYIVKWENIRATLEKARTERIQAPFFAEGLQKNDVLHKLASRANLYRLYELASNVNLYSFTKCACMGAAPNPGIAKASYTASRYFEE